MLFLILLPKIFTQTLWKFVGNYRNQIFYIEHADFINAREYCVSDNGIPYTSLQLLYLLFLSSIVIIVAYKTRKIRMLHFKDMKKVNSFIFIFILITAIVIFLWLLFRSLEDYVAEIVTLYLGMSMGSFLCQVFLFLPKVWPPIQRRMHV